MLHGIAQLSMLLANVAPTFGAGDGWFLATVDFTEHRARLSFVSSPIRNERIGGSRLGLPRLGLSGWGFNIIEAGTSIRQTPFQALGHLA
jgi:hypothetical protein